MRRKKDDEDDEGDVDDDDADDNAEDEGEGAAGVGGKKKKEKKAAGKKDEPGPVVPLPAAFVALKGCQLRSGSELDSEKAERLEEGEEVTVIERVELADPDGNAVVRLHVEGKGWVSEVSTTGRRLLQLR